MTGLANSRKRRHVFSVDFARSRSPNHHMHTIKGQKCLLWISGRLEIGVGAKTVRIRKDRVVGRAGKGAWKAGNGLNDRSGHLPVRPLPWWENPGAREKSPGTSHHRGSGNGLIPIRSLGHRTENATLPPK